MSLHPAPNKIIARLIDAIAGYWTTVPGTERTRKILEFPLGEQTCRLETVLVDDLSSENTESYRLSGTIVIDDAQMAGFTLVHHVADDRMPSFLGFHEFMGSDRVQEGWWLNRLEDLLDQPRETWPWVARNKPLTPEEASAFWKDFSAKLRGQAPKADSEVIREALSDMISAVSRLSSHFRDHKRRFTIDGRLLGDIGEIIAWQHFDIDLDEVSKDRHDATFAGDRRVNIKVTMQDKIHVKKIPDYCLALKLNTDGSHEVVFNGPGHLLEERWGRRKGYGIEQIGCEIVHLRELNKKVDEKDRVPLRKQAP